MQVLAMTVELNGKTFVLRRFNDPESGSPINMVEVTSPGEEGRMAYAVADRETCFEMATAIAREAYGKRRRGDGPDCTNSMVHDITDAVERVAGC